MSHLDFLVIDPVWCCFVLTKVEFAVVEKAAYALVSHDRFQTFALTLAGCWEGNGWVVARPQDHRKRLKMTQYLPTQWFSLLPSALVLSQFAVRYVAWLPSPFFHAASFSSLEQDRHHQCHLLLQTKLLQWLPASSTYAMLAAIPLLFYVDHAIPNLQGRVVLIDSQQISYGPWTQLPWGEIKWVEDSLGLSGLEEVKQMRNMASTAESLKSIVMPSAGTLMSSSGWVLRAVHVIKATNGLRHRSKVWIELWTTVIEFRVEQIW